MAVVKNEFPILEYDTEKEGIIKPGRHGNASLPEICVMTFFGEVLGAFVAEHKAKIGNGHYNSEMRAFPIYAFEYGGIEMCAMQAAVGSGSIAMQADFLIGYGVRKISLCGCCGVLTDIPAGDVVVAVAALRDEGASYHYLPPSREIELDRDIVAVIKSTLDENHVPYIECKTWSTDAFYRETPDMVAYRREEGCQVVEMECAAAAAVARFRGARFGQLLYSGDILTDPSNYDERDWGRNLTAREKLFYLSLEAAAKLR